MSRSRAEARYNSLMQLCVGNDYFEDFKFNHDPWLFGRHPDIYVNGSTGSFHFILTSNEVTILVTEKVLIPELSDKEFAVQKALGLVERRKYIFTKDAFIRLGKIDASFLFDNYLYTLTGD
jgi:hypothetical protein